MHLYTPLRSVQRYQQALREMINFMEFTWSRNSSTFGVSEIRNLTCQQMRHVGECHVPDTLIGLGKTDIQRHVVLV